MAERRKGAARAVPLPAPRARLDTRRLLPSARSLAVGVGLLALSAGAYLAALETSVFSVRELAIAGGTSRIQAEVRAALAPELGRSLLRVSGNDLERRAAAIPDVISIRFDRAFPHTLKITVTPERAVLLLRRVKSTWVVSARGRVMRQISDPRRSSLPRMWVPKDSQVTVGSTLTRLEGGLAAAALAPLSRGALPGGVRFVRSSTTELTLVLRSGLEIRLGGVGDLRLKLAIARRVVRLAGAEISPGSYVDVSVPERPVLDLRNSQVGT